MKTKRMAEQITHSLKAQLVSRQMYIEQLADLTANKIKQAAVGAIDGYAGNISELSGSEIKYEVEKAVTPVQKQFIKDVNALQSKLVQEEVAQAAEKLKRIWQDMDFDAAALPITNRFAAAIRSRIKSAKSRSRCAASSTVICAISARISQSSITRAWSRFAPKCAMRSTSAWAR